MPGRSVKKRNRRKKPNIIHLLLVLLCLSAMLFIGVLVLTLRSQRQFRQLSRQVHTEETLPPQTAATVPPTVPPTTAPPQTTVPTEAPTVPTTLPPTEPPTEPPPPTVLPAYQELSEENPDLFGWLTIDDTRIDYPVMYSPQEPEKYLHADFHAKYSFAGTPFVDGSCSPDSDNLLIYAHNMLDGSMFRSLLNYQEKPYWQKHPVISFDTLYAEGEYEVLAAFYDRVYYKTETCFKFYQFIDAQDEAHFDDAIAQFKDKSLYDTGVSASYGDKLITLVTCAYHTENGRFVVVARQKQ